jgi:hypothetical protein
MDAMFAEAPETAAYETLARRVTTLLSWASHVSECSMPQPNGCRGTTPTTAPVLDTQKQVHFAVLQGVKQHTGTLPAPP